MCLQMIQNVNSNLKYVQMCYGGLWRNRGGAAVQRGGAAGMLG